MKIAIVSESPADEAAIRILVDQILGVETELVFSTRLRPQGWPSVLNLLPSIIKHLHYQTDAKGLVVVVDSDESEVHQSAHEGSEMLGTDCRLCRLRHTTILELQRLRAVPNRAAMVYAIGVAVPAIEAWYQCGVDAHVNENTWIRRLMSESITYDRKSLKRAAYGSDRPSLAIETRAAEEAAKRLAVDLELLEQLFPNGFGSLLRGLRRWREA